MKAGTCRYCACQKVQNKSASETLWVRGTSNCRISLYMQYWDVLKLTGFVDRWRHGYTHNYYEVQVASCLGSIQVHTPVSVYPCVDEGTRAKPRYSEAKPRITGQKVHLSIVYPSWKEVDGQQSYHYCLLCVMTGLTLNHFANMPPLCCVHYRLLNRCSSVRLYWIS